jgi:hypothetical protein
MPRPKRHIRAKYRSGLEKEVAKQLRNCKVDFTYEEEKIKYVQPVVYRTYTPDFRIITRGTGKVIFVETKGIWDAQDRYKHLLIRQQHPELDIRFVFTNAAAKISKRSKTTYADICQGNGRAPFKGVVWQYATKKIPREWLDE